MSSEHREVASFEAMQRACMDASDAELSAYYALCAFQLASEAQRESSSMRNAMERALDGAIARKNRGLAEFLFDQFSDYLSTISVKQYVQELHMLTAQALEEMGVDAQQLFSLSDLLEQVGSDVSSTLIRLPDVNSNTNTKSSATDDYSSATSTDISHNASHDVDYTSDENCTGDYDNDVQSTFTYGSDATIDSDADSDARDTINSEADSDAANGAADEKTNDAAHADTPVIVTTENNASDENLVARRFSFNAPRTSSSSNTPGNSQHPRLASPALASGKASVPERDSTLYDNPLHMVLADQNTVSKLVGFDSLIDELHTCGISATDSVSCEFIKRLQLFHGMKRAPLSEPLMVQVNDPFEADLVVNALIHEIDKPTLRISSQYMPEGFQALALSSENFSRLQVRSMLVSSNFSGCLVLENVDQWDTNPSEIYTKDPRERHAWESAFRDVFNLIIGAMHNDQTSIVLTAENCADIDPELLQLVQPCQTLNVGIPSSAERSAIWKYLQSKHRSMRHLDCALLTRLTKGLSRGALYLSTDVALREAYDVSVRTQKMHPVSLLNLLEKLSYCFEDESPEQLAINSMIMREFRDDISTVEATMNAHVPHECEHDASKHADAPASTEEEQSHASSDEHVQASPDNTSCGGARNSLGDGVLNSLGNKNDNSSSNGTDNTSGGGADNTSGDDRF